MDWMKFNDSSQHISHEHVHQVCKSAQAMKSGYLDLASDQKNLNLTYQEAGSFLIGAPWAGVASLGPDWDSLVGCHSDPSFWVEKGRRKLISINIFTHKHAFRRYKPISNGNNQKSNTVRIKRMIKEKEALWGPRHQHCFSEFLFSSNISLLSFFSSHTPLFSSLSLCSVLYHIFIFSLLPLCLFTQTDMDSICYAPCALMQREITHFCSFSRKVINHVFIYRELTIHMEHVCIYNLLPGWWMLTVRGYMLKA